MPTRCTSCSTSSPWVSDLLADGAAAINPYGRHTFVFLNGKGKNLLDIKV